MGYARAVIAAVLATGLVVIVVMQEVSNGKDDVAESLDPTYLLLALAIIILVLPDALNYFRQRKNGKKDEEDK